MCKERETGSGAGNGTGQGLGEALKDVRKTDITVFEASMEHKDKAATVTGDKKTVEPVEAVSRSEKLLAGQPVVVPRKELKIEDISAAHEAVGLKLSSNSHKRKKYLSKAQERRKQQEKLHSHPKGERVEADGAVAPKDDVKVSDARATAFNVYEGITDLDALLLGKKGETPFDVLMSKYDVIRELFTHLPEYEAELRRRQMDAGKAGKQDEALLRSEARFRTLREIKGYYDSIEELMKTRYYVYLPMDDMLKLSTREIRNRLAEQYKLPPQPEQAAGQQEPEEGRRIYRNRELIDFYEKLLRLKRYGFSEGRSAKELEAQNLVYVKREIKAPEFKKNDALPQDEAGKKAELIRIAGIFSNLAEFLNDPDSVAPKAEFIRQFAVTFRVDEYRDAFSNTPQDQIPAKVRAMLSAIGQAAPAVSEAERKEAAPDKDPEGEAAPTVKAEKEKVLLSEEQIESVRQAGAFLMERCLKESDDYKTYVRELKIQPAFIPGDPYFMAAQMPPAVIPLRSEWKNHVPFVFRMMERSPEELLIAFYLLENDKQDDATGVNFLSVRRNYQPDAQKLGERLKHLTDWGKLSRALRSSPVILQWLKEFDTAEESVHPTASSFPVQAQAIKGMDMEYEQQGYNNCYCCTGTAMVNQFIALRKMKAGSGSGTVTRIVDQYAMRAYRPDVRIFEDNNRAGVAQSGHDTEIRQLDEYCGPGKLAVGSIAQMNDFILDALHRQGIDDVLLHNTHIEMPPRPEKKTKTDQEHAQDLVSYEAEKKTKRERFAGRIREILESGSVAGVMTAVPYVVDDNTIRYSIHYVTVTGYDPDHGLLQIYDSLGYTGHPVEKTIDSLLETDGMRVEIDWISDRPNPVQAGADPNNPDPLVQKFPYLSGGPQYSLNLPPASDDAVTVEYSHMYNASISHTKGISVSRREGGILESVYIPQDVPKNLTMSLDEYMSKLSKGEYIPTTKNPTPQAEDVSTTSSARETGSSTVPAQATDSAPAQVTVTGSKTAPDTITGSKTAPVTATASSASPDTVKASSATPVSKTAPEKTLTKEQTQVQYLMEDIRKRMQLVMMLHRMAGMPMEMPADLAEDPELRKRLVAEMSEIERQRARLLGIVSKMDQSAAPVPHADRISESGPDPLNHHVEGGPEPLEVAELTADVSKEYVGDTLIEGTVQSLEAAGGNLSFTEGSQYLMGSGVAVGILSIAGLIKDVIGTISLASQKGLTSADMAAKSLGLIGDYTGDIGGAFDAVGRIVASSAEAAKSAVSNVHTPFVVKSWLADSSTSLLQNASQAGAWATITGGALGVIAGAIQVSAASVQMVRQVNSAKDVAAARKELKNTIKEKKERGEKLTPDEERLELFLSHQSREIGRKEASAAVGIINGALTGVAGGLFMTGYLAPVGAILGITSMFIGAGAKICDWIMKSENRDMAVDEYLHTDERIEELKKDRSYAGIDEREFRIRVRDLVLAEQGFSSVKECFRHVCIQYASVLYSKVFIEDISDEERKMFVDAMSSLGMEMNDRKAVERGEKPIPSIEAMVTRMMG